MTQPPTPYRICFVCSGNICRSPMAEVVTDALLAPAGLGERVRVDSAGTGGWHEGDPADPRTIEALRRHGYDGGRHRARQLQPGALAQRDLVLVADRGHLRALRAMARTPQERERIQLMRDYDPTTRGSHADLADPWYGGEEEFETCLAEVEALSRGLVDVLRDQLGESEGGTAGSGSAGTDAAAAIRW